MSELLNSVKADLLDRRMLPLIVLIGAALLGAVAYIALGSGSSSAPTPAVAKPLPGAGGGAGLVVSQSPAATGQPVAETTSGVIYQHAGKARDPFAPLTAPAKTATAATTSTPASTGSSASATSSSSSSSSSSSTGSSGTSTPSTPSAPPKPATVYHVAVLFGVVPAGTPAQSAQLTPHENLGLLTPLPSAKQALVVYRGVTASIKAATFTLVGEVIIHGPGICLPGPSQCQEIALKAGQAEQLETLDAAGEAVTYELRVTSISSGSATTASLRGVTNSESKAGRELLRHSGLLALAGLHYSQVGVLASDAHASARLARAHLARHRG